MLGLLTLYTGYRHRVVFGVWPDAATMEATANALPAQPVGVLASALVACIAFAAYALLPASLSSDIMTDRLRLGHRPWWGAWGFVAAIGMFGVGALCSGVFALAGWEGRGALGELQRAFAHPSASIVALAVGILGFGAGAGEELFFRGYLQTRLAQRWGAFASVFVSAALFGIAHLDPMHSTFAFLVGLLLGWVSLRAGTIRVTLVAHVLNNVLSVAALAAGRAEAHTSPREARAMIVAGAVAVGLCIALFRRVDARDA